MNKLLFILCGTFFLSSCEESYVQKPTGYNRIELPEAAYQTLDWELPYTFEYSKHAVVKKHSSWLSEPYWIDIEYPAHKATVEITYKPLKGKTKSFNDLIDDSHTIAFKHKIKAQSIDEWVIGNNNGCSGMAFELTGEVPSQFQFYMTDSSKHYVRGALYFRTATKNDSLAPVIEYIKKDMMHMANSLKWR